MCCSDRLNSPPEAAIRSEPAYLLAIARQDLPPGVSPDQAVVLVRDPLVSIGDTWMNHSTPRRMRCSRLLRRLVANSSRTVSLSRANLGGCVLVVSLRGPISRAAPTSCVPAPDPAAGVSRQPPRA
jgi:hypothetical protein